MKSNLLILSFRSKRIGVSEQALNQVMAKQDELKAVAAQADQTRAALSEVEGILADLTVRAPVNGVITTKIINPGEVVVPGSPLLEWYCEDPELEDVFLQLIGKVAADASIRPGQPVMNQNT